MAEREDPRIRSERIQNLWNSVARKHPSLSQSMELEPTPDLAFDEIGGLATAKEELLTYSCAATNPEVYSNWGTQPPPALLLIGRRGCGKNLLARALAARTGTPFLRVSVPRLVLEVVRHGGKVGDILTGWDEALAELGPTTIFFDELEFSQAQDLGTQRMDLPIGPIMDFLLDMVDRTILADGCQLVGSTAYPQSLRPAFRAPGRFERVVEVTPNLPHDVVEALHIHARAAEKRAGRTLFASVDWERVVSGYRQPSTGDWVRIMHAALRRKARREAAGEDPGPVSTEDLLHEVERVRHTDNRLASPGHYL